VAVSASTTKSTAVAGGGSIAVNSLRGATEAVILSSDLAVGGDVEVRAEDESAIQARVLAAAVAVGVGGQSTPAVALGLAVAVNEIGWDRISAPAPDHRNTRAVTELRFGDTVLIEQGPLRGQTYEYVGDDRQDKTGISLAAENFHDRSLWRRADLESKRAVVRSLIDGSRVEAAGALLVDAR
jgi:hypothetical protein